MFLHIQLDACLMENIAQVCKYVDAIWGRLQSASYAGLKQQIACHRAFQPQVRVSGMIMPFSHSVVELPSGC